MNADPRVYERDRQKIWGKGEAQPDVQNLKKELKLYQSDSHKMKSLMMNGAAMRNGITNPHERPVNPIWTNYPTRCVRPIRTADEMRKKLEYFTHSDDVLVVRYHQNNCTACNALDKTFEFLCHEAEKSYPNLRFYDINKDDAPELTKGLVRFPQVKGYSGGQWVDLEFKPPAAFREQLYQQVEREVRKSTNEGKPITALQAEEMYFSAAGPSMLMLLDESITNFYKQSQVRAHNYWKQVSVRRTWFFKKFIEPRVDEAVREEWSQRSVFGETVKLGPELPQ